MQNLKINTNKEHNNSTLKKFIIILGTLLILLIPLGFLSSTIENRKNYQSEATNKITQSWGKQQRINTPFIEYTIIETIKDENNRITKKNILESIEVDTYNVDVKLNTEIRQKGFFKVPVYTADVKLAGVFDIKNKNAYNQSLTFLYPVADSIGFTDKPVLKIDNKEILLNDSTYEFKLTNPTDKLPFEISYKLRGTDSIKIDTWGNYSQVKITGNWNSPSFKGDFLPNKRTVGDNQFSAEWNIPKIATSTLKNPHVEVSLLIPVDNYRMTERAMKYSFLFLSLTFMFYFIFETITKEQQIHPLQYILLGLAMQIFYLLLLAISEFTSFNTAYSIASLMTIGLISLYTHFVITKGKNKKFSLTIFGLLILLYGLLYSLLKLEDYALLMGSFGLFLVIATIMYVTRNINWYED